jgi:hypothetical protein
MNANQCPKMTTRIKARNFVKALRYTDIKKSPFKLFSQIYHASNKTAVRRELTVRFVMKLLAFEKNISEIGEIIKYHKQHYKAPSKIDSIIYKPLKEIVETHESISRQKRIINNLRKLKSESKRNSSISNIYTVSHFMSMKPIYSYSRY